MNSKVQKIIVWIMLIAIIAFFIVSLFVTKPKFLIFNTIISNIFDDFFICFSSIMKTIIRIKI